MAIDLCSETSPRISFSHDLGQTDVVPLDPQSKSRLDSSLLDSNSNSDFEFGILEHESSSADELFAGGVILPIQIRERTATPKRVHDCLTQPLLSLPPRPGPSSTSGSSKNGSLKEIMAVNSESEEKPQFKSFWSFKRSTSLNGDNKSLLCSIPLISRSNSTGSVPNQKRATISSSSRDATKQNSHKSPSIPTAKSASATNTTASFYTYQMQQKVQQKKNFAGSHGHGGGRISPVLNVPPPYISKSTANLFGLGSFFSNGKDKKNKR